MRAFEPKLVIEIDGGHHALQLEEDGRRSDWLANNGFRVLRFWNYEVLQHTDTVLEKVRRSLLSVEQDDEVSVKRQAT